MNVFHKVTLESLRKNRIRTGVTIIGVLLSAAMITAVTTFASSMQNYLVENMIYLNGDWHGTAFDTGWEMYETIQNSEEIEKAVYSQQLGYARIEDCENEYKPYLYVMGAGDGFWETMPVHLISGTLPRSQSEILLPEHLALDGGVRYKLGDTLTLQLGDRMLDGFRFGQQQPCFDYVDGEAVKNDEILTVKETRTYTVVGFYQRPNFEEYDAPGYTAITLADVNPLPEDCFDVYFSMKNLKDIYGYMEDNGIYGIRNHDVLTASGFSRYGAFYEVLYGMAAIVIALIMLGSISLIYNAFSISISERTKQFGLLSSVGATRKQLRKMVLFEAMVVSAVGIPLGILAGVGGIGVTLLLIGSKFRSVLGYPIVLQLCVSPEAIVIACLVALVTVLISAWIPSRRASKVSAVEAIRQNQDIQIRSGTVKTSRLMYRLFGFSGMLASKHYRRNRRKYRQAVISLFMSVVLFISAAAFSDYLMESVEGGFGGEKFDILVYCNHQDLEEISADELLDQLRSEAEITGGTYVKRRTTDGLMAKEFLSEERAAYCGEDADAEICVINYFVEDDTFRALLKEYGLQEDIFMNAEKPLAIAVDGMRQFDSEKGQFEAPHILRSDESEFRYTTVSGEEIVLRSGKTIYERPYYVEDPYADLVWIYPFCALEQAMPDLAEQDISREFFLTSEDHFASTSKIKEMLASYGISAENVRDYAADEESDRNLVLIIQVFAYGFIVLISLIAAANVFNTISTNISLRRREFAMLRSVGMTNRGLHRMMNYECMLYGSKALLYGLPAATGVTYLIYLSVAQGYSTDFHMPWLAVGIAVFSVFAVVFATMLYAMSKIQKDNLIDALKSENL